MSNYKLTQQEAIDQFVHEMLTDGERLFTTHGTSGAKTWHTCNNCGATAWEPFQITHAEGCKVATLLKAFGIDVKQ